MEDLIYITILDIHGITRVKRATSLEMAEKQYKNFLEFTEGVDVNYKVSTYKATEIFATQGEQHGKIS